MPPTEIHDPVSILMTQKSVPQYVEDFWHGSLKATPLFIDLTSTNVDGKYMQVNNENRNVFEDIPLFTGEDSRPENSFPTFYIHSVNECLSLWKGDTEDLCMKSNMKCILQKLNRPVI